MDLHRITCVLFVRLHVRGKVVELMKIGFIIYTPPRPYPHNHIIIIITTISRKGLPQKYLLELLVDESKLSSTKIRPSKRKEKRKGGRKKTGQE